MTMRAATGADLPSILALLADDDLGKTRELHPGQLSAYQAAFAAIEQDLNNHLMVLEKDGAVVGCFQLTLIPGLSRGGAWRGQIESVRVSSSHRGRGLGEQMMRWAISECRRRGCRLIQLTTDKRRPAAHRFYERLGFVASHEGMKLDI